MFLETERCESGLISTLGKRVSCKVIRGSSPTLKPKFTTEKSMRAISLHIRATRKGKNGEYQEALWEVANPC